MFHAFADKHKQMVNEYPCRTVVKNPTHFAVIVEPRSHPEFEFVCKTILRFTPNHWGLHVFHGTENEGFVKEALDRIPNILFTNLNVKNLTITSYNELLSSVWFYEQCKTKKILVFQTDSCLLKEGIDEFMHHDYIGAPWPFHNNRVGNGGFSVRDVSKCKYICETFNRPNGMNEDVFFSLCMEKIDANVASYEEACAFSCENIPTQTLPLGVHQKPGYIQLDLDAVFAQNFRKNIK